MLKPQFQLALFVAGGLLAGCGQVAVFGHTIGERRPVDAVKTEAEPARAAVPSQAMLTLKSVNLLMTQQASTQVAKDPRFRADALLEAITAELRSRKLLNDTDQSAQQSGHQNDRSTAEISIDDFSLRPTSNAVIFGRIISAGSLNGEIHVRDADGGTLQNFRVEAASQVSIAANGETANPLEPLYRRFAVLAGDRLAGIQSRSGPGADQHYRTGT